MSIATFCKLTKISRDFAFPVLNYTGRVDPTNPAQDLLALFPMNAAVEQAKQFVISDLQKSVRLMDATTNARIGDGDILLKEGELDSPISVLREATSHHTKVRASLMCEVQHTHAVIAVCVCRGPSGIFLSDEEQARCSAR